MSDPNFQPLQQPYGADPKATAAMAKAYAKSQRKWYQKKRWWAAIVIVVIIAASASGLAGKKNDGPKVVGNGPGGSSNTSDGNAPGTKGNPVKIGTTVELEGTRYTVKKVSKAKTLGASQFSSGSTANGTFVVVTLTIENRKNETKTFMESAAKFIGSNGASYSTDSSGTFANIMGDAKPLILEDMQPLLPKTGILVFDVPTSAVKGGVLEVSDLFGNGSAYIKLGLK